MPADPVLRVDHLGKRFGARWLFRELSFDLHVGDRLVVLGANGSGKSTLLRMVAGLEETSEGLISTPEGSDPRHVIGLATLEMALYPALTAREHLAFAATLRSIVSSPLEVLERVELAYAQDVPAAQLSTGMKARLKLALAIQAQPLILLLDEPGASLDEAGRDVVQRICEDQAQRGALIIATNDARERRLASLEVRLDD